MTEEIAREEVGPPKRIHVLIGLVGGAVGSLALMARQLAVEGAWELLYQALLFGAGCYFVCSYLGRVVYRLR